MAEYNKRQLLELVGGAFKCSPNEKAFYGSINGTFLNQDQYDKLDTKEQGNYEKFTNPRFASDGKKLSDDETKKVDAEAKEAASKATAEKKAKADAEKKAKAEAAKKKKAEAAAKKTAAAEKP